MRRSFACKLLSLGLLAGCADEAPSPAPDASTLQAGQAGQGGQAGQPGQTAGAGQAGAGQAGAAAGSSGTSGYTGQGGVAGAAGKAGAAGAAGGPSGGGAGGGDAAYPEGLLCQPGGADPRCGAGFDAGKALAEGALKQALAEGYEAWTYPGKGGACVSCHSPDGIDLAWVGFSDCDIHRRAIKHVDEARANALVTYVHGLRQRHAIERPLHPDRYRPLQPGYEPFGEVASDLDVADTKKQDDRDLMFMKHLVDERKLLFASGTVDSLARAHQAYDELLAIDLPSLRLGVPFDRLSEDPDASVNSCSGGGGPAHMGKSIFEWIPAIPMTPRPELAQPWEALKQAYLADPSDANLWAYLDTIDDTLVCGIDLAKDGDPAFYSRACEWMKLKFKSLQITQHMLRRRTAHPPDVLAGLGKPNEPPFAGDHLDLVIRRNPIWEAGDFIRKNPLARQGNPACFSSPAHPCTLLPPDIDATIHDLPDPNEARIRQGDLFQLSWLMMGFLHDPALVHQSHEVPSFIGDYLEAILLPRYDIHHAFVFAQEAVRKSAAKEWFGAEGFRKGTGKLASVRTFSFKQVRNNLSPPPADSPRHAVHRRMFANFARMFLYLVEEDMRVSGTAFGLDARSDQEGGLLVAMRFLRGWIAEIEGKEDPSINQLMLSIEALGLEVVELRDEQNKKEHEGLAPTYTWGDFQQPYGG